MGNLTFVELDIHWQVWYTTTWTDVAPLTMMNGQFRITADCTVKNHLVSTASVDDVLMTIHPFVFNGYSFDVAPPSQKSITSPSNNCSSPFRILDTMYLHGRTYHRHFCQTNSQLYTFSLQNNQHTYISKQLLGGDPKGHAYRGAYCENVG